MNKKIIYVFILFGCIISSVMAEEAVLEEQTAPAVIQAPATPPIISKNSLSLGFARRIALAAEMKAKELKTSVSIVVLDEAQNIKIEYIMDGQTRTSLDWARSKALSAFEFKQPTNKGEFKVWNIADKTMVLGVAGGYPLLNDGVLLGAIGISGTRGAEDDIIAQVAQNEFNKLFNVK